MATDAELTDLVKNGAKIYAISTTVSRERCGWTSTRQLPTFYLDGDVQGIVSEDHAERIARDVLSGWNDNDNTELYLTVVAIEKEESPAKTDPVGWMSGEYDKR